MESPPVPSPIQVPPSSLWHRVANALLGLVALIAFFFLFHNYGVTILPPERIVIRPEEMSPLPGPKSFAYVYHFDRSEPDVWWKPRSQVQLFEDATKVRSHMFLSDEVRLVGGDRWTHEPGRILFASVDNSDPRTNGRTYSLLSPRFYTRKIGYAAAITFLAAALGLILVNWKLPRAPLVPPPLPAPGATASRWRRHLLGASVLLLVGLYFNTGTLSPYGNTHFGHLVKETGYLYNNDHPHFKVLFDFVDGAPKKVWDKALLLRRVLYDVIAWPFMKVGGFEIGGTIASLVFNVGGFAWAMCLLRRRIGERGAIFAAWILSLCPGAMYWGGLPYPYALIFPLSLLLTIALMDLPGLRLLPVAVLSFAMGVAYLSYDLAVFFLPASLVLLVWKRRPGAAALSVGLQVIPTACWMFYLSRILGQNLENSNTAVYRVILNSYFNVKDKAAWWAYVSDFPNVGLDVWFGANFIFLPALFLVVLAFNPVTSRIRFAPAETALLLVTLGLFFFNNLAPDYYGATSWVMRGTWISRIYQPVFPALIFFAARWWQALPPLNWPRRSLVWLMFGAVCAGNALIVFGPIFNNPLKVSEHAFYRFYNHSDLHWLYETHLRDYGRRPIGFPKPQP